MKSVRVALTLTSAVLIGSTLGLSACNKADKPEDVQANVAKAQQDAADANSKADQKRKDTEAQARTDLDKDVAAARAKAADRSISAVADAAVTEAEGANKVALAKCDAMEGDAQQQCKDAANKHLADVKDRAKAATASTQ